MGRKKIELELTYDELWKRLWRDNQTCAEIGEELGVNSLAVWRRVKELKIPTRRRGQRDGLHPQAVLTQEDRLAILQRGKGEGHESHSVLAVEFGVSRQRIHQLCKEKEV